MKKITYTLLAFLLPVLAHAQVTPANNGDMSTLQGILRWIITQIDQILIPLVFSLALIFFLFGVFKYFFSSGATAEEKRLQGKKYIGWAIIAFVVMVSIWGIVNVITGTFKFDDAERPSLPCFSGDDCNQAVRPTAPALR